MHLSLSVLPWGATMAGTVSVLCGDIHPAPGTVSGHSSSSFDVYLMNEPMKGEPGHFPYAQQMFTEHLSHAPPVPSLPPGEVLP